MQIDVASDEDDAAAAVATATAVADTDDHDGHADAMLADASSSAWCTETPAGKKGSRARLRGEANSRVTAWRSQLRSVPGMWMALGGSMPAGQRGARCKTEWQS
eukprot:6790525-Alexandrium_andersonii.AAC.1